MEGKKGKVDDKDVGDGVVVLGRWVLVVVGVGVVVVMTTLYTRATVSWVAVDGVRVFLFVVLSACVLWNRLSKRWTARISLLY